MRLLSIYSTYTLLLIGLLCPACILPKHTLSIGASGVVLDAQTRSPLRDVSVSVLDYSGQARHPIKTGDDGSFSILHLQRRTLTFPPGDFAPPGQTFGCEKGWI